MPPAAANASEDASAASARIGVQLLGTPRRHVGVKLAVLLPPAEPAAAGGSGRNATGGTAAAARWAAADPSQLWLEPATLSWAAWERPSTKYVTLRSAAELPLALALQTALGASTSSAAGLPLGQPLLRVVLAAAQGATIARPQNATSLVLHASEAEGEAAEDGVPLFGFNANQVAYPPSGSSSGGNSSSGVARVPVRLLAGQLQEAATVRFVVRLLAPLGSSLMLQQFLPTRASHGFLYFRPKEPAAANSSTATAAEPPQQQVQWVDLPLAWDRIPPEAEYRLGEPPSCRCLRSSAFYSVVLQQPLCMRLVWCLHQMLSRAPGCTQNNFVRSAVSCAQDWSLRACTVLVWRHSSVQWRCTSLARGKALARQALCWSPARIAATASGRVAAAVRQALTMPRRQRGLLA